MLLVENMCVDLRSDKDGERRGAIREKSCVAEAGAGRQHQREVRVQLTGMLP
jgi:hypothetical protein